MLTCQKPGDAQQKSEHPFLVFRIIRFRMSSKCFQRFPIGFVDLIQKYIYYIFGNVFLWIETVKHYT